SCLYCSMPILRSSYPASFYIHLRHPSCNTLFPYTTLFRSPETARRILCPRPKSRLSMIDCSIARMKPLTGSRVPFAQPEASFKRSEEHTSELQSRGHLVCRLLLEKKNELYQNAMVVMYDAG